MMTETTTPSATENTVEYNPPSHYDIFNAWWRNYLAGSLLLLLVVSMPGNLLTVIACIKNKELRSPAHLLILNQSVGDLVSSLMSINVAGPAFFKYKRGKTYCLFTQAGVFIGLETSVLNLMAISVDRFLAVVFTFQYFSWVTSRRVNVTICFLWSITAFVQLLPVMGWNTWQEGALCQSPYVLPPKFFNIFFILPVLSSLLFTAIGNVIIGVIAIKKSKKIGDITDESRLLLARTQLKVTKMLLLVVGTFYACWMPYIVINSLLRYPPTSWQVNGVPEPTDLVFLISQLLLIVSTVINPFIYAYKDKDFRRAYKKLLGIQRRTNPVHHDTRAT